jgi:hypothetical protein
VPSANPDDEQEARLRRELETIKAQWLERRKDDISYAREAFFDQYNLITLVGLGALTAVSAVTMPLATPLLGSLLVGWEVAWMGIAPSSPRFRRSVRARKNAADLEQRDAKRKAGVGALPPELKGRFEAAAAIAREIRAQAEQHGGEDELNLLEETLAKLDHLLEQYAQMLGAAHRIGQLLRSPEGATLKRRVVELEKELAKLEPGRLREAKEKNLAVLRQRADRFDRSKEEKEYLDVSLETLENTLKLVRDQVVAATSAGSISSSLDGVLVELGRHREHMQNVERELHGQDAPEKPAAAPPVADLEKSDTGSISKAALQAELGKPGALPPIDIPAARMGDLGVRDPKKDEEDEKERWQKALGG